MIGTIRSGGQTGVDRAALDVAIENGIYKQACLFLNELINYKNH